VARDAFNGVLLWERSFSTWFPHIVNWGQTPSQLQRRLVAAGDRVYVTLGLHAPLSVVDAQTGEILKVYEETAGTEEIILHKGILLLAIRSVTRERIEELKKWAGLVAAKDSPLDARESAEPLVRRLRASEAKGEKAVVALNADSGRLLWKKAGADVSRLRADSLCAGGERVFYQNGQDVVCVDLKTGRELWSRSSATLRLVWGESVFCADGAAIEALSAGRGEALWRQVPSVIQIQDVFVAGGSLWVGGFKPIKGKRGPSWGPYFATQRDPATGKTLMHVEPENPGHHHRCYANKATDRYILAGRRGTEFIDLKSGEVRWNNWARGVCRYGIMPCNGLLYAPPHACGCYMAAKLIGFNALAPRQEKAPAPRVDSPRLEVGAAFDSPAAAARASGSGDWPTYRHDAERSGCTGLAVAADLHQRWRAEVGGRLSSPTVAEGTVFAASVDQHTVAAMDADSGRCLWRFTAGARVDSPPTL
jgi:outer membrane protein assembly factor BamB